MTVRQTCFTLYVSQPFHTFLVFSHFCKYVHVPYFGNLSCISQLLSTDLYMNPGRPGRPVCNKIHKKTFRPFLFVWELPKSEFFLCAHKGPHHLHMRLLRNQEVLLGGGVGGGVSGSQKLLASHPGRSSYLQTSAFTPGLGLGLHNNSCNKHDLHSFTLP